MAMPRLAANAATIAFLDPSCTGLRLRPQTITPADIASIVLV
jgi:hypothetical protein